MAHGFLPPQFVEGTCTRLHHLATRGIIDTRGIFNDNEVSYLLFTISLKYCLSGFLGI